MSKNWSNKEIEKLFFTAKKYNFSTIEFNVTINTHLVKEIFNEVNLEDRDEKAILYKLADMKFLNSKRNSKKDAIFYRNDKINFETFSTSPCYKKFTIKENEILNDIIPKTITLSYDVDDLSKNVAEKLTDRTSLNIKKHLYGKYIELDGKGGYSLIQGHGKFKVSNEQSEIDKLITKKKISKKLSKEINSIRADISKIYNPHNSDAARIIFSNDGTGFGKSYGVFDQFISNVDSTKEHKNMFFITPLKSQIKIDESQIESAKTKGIEFLSYLSRGDISNLHFNNWITGENNFEKYKRWIKDNKSKKGTLIKNELFKLDSIIGSIQYLEDRIENDSNLDYSEEKELKIDKNKKENQLCAIIEEMSLKIINFNSEKLSIIDIFERANEYIDIFELYSEIIKTSFPLEFSKFKPCILLATTDKFDVSIPILTPKKKSPLFTTKYKSFYELLGQKKQSDNEDLLIGKYVAEKFENQVEFLKNNYFNTEEDSYFRKNNISFHIIIDEEHDSYKTFFKKGKINLIDEDCKLEDVLASTYRLYLTNENSDSNSGFNNYYSIASEEGNDFVKNLKKLFNKHCDISKHMSVKEILKLFSNNTNGIAIDGNQIEHISNITKNVFNFSSKRFFNENSLKKISFRSHNNDTICEIYTKTDKNDNNPTMYDIYQLIMVVLAACSSLKLRGKLHKSLGLRHDKNHNNPLHVFINKAISVKKDVEYIFNRTDNEDLIINHFFTYFQPKTIFSIERRDDFTFIPESKGVIYVDFSMELRKELPETNVIKLLYNTKNSIVTLSATSGIKNNFTGNYNRNMLSIYGDKNALNFDLITRNLDDSYKLENLRSKRGEIRNVIINEINQDSDSIKNEDQDISFKKVYKEWLAKLKFYAPKNKYHNLEHRRQLKSLLLASYDEKNTLVLSLTNNFIKTIKKYFENNAETMSKSISILDNNNAIFDFKPFSNKSKLRVILFNSDLDKKINVRRYTEINNINTKLVFISSYTSAGTGLNYFTKYISTNNDDLRLEEDFERLVLANTPFYSEVKGNSSLNTIDNYITLLKYFSEECNGTKHLKDFSTNLVNGENYNILMNEHNLAVFKVILQAIGRVERKDTKLESELFLPAEMITSSTIQFINLNRDGLNKIMVNSMSLLNTNFMNYCLNKGEKESFKSTDERKKFEEEISNNYKNLKFFVDKILLKLINDFRNGIVSDISLNEDFRHKDTIFNPEKAMERLKNNKFIKDNGYEHIIDMMYIDTQREDLKGIKLCSYKNEFNKITDINHGFSSYEPYELIIPSYNNVVVEDKNSLAFSVLNHYYRIVKESRFIPNPYLIPLFIGNMGELLFSDVLKEKSIYTLSIVDIKEKLNSELYELFDSYIEVEDHLICVDVKNWSNTFEKTDLSLTTQEKAEDKISTVKKILKGNNINYKKVHFVYVNSKIENNELNIKPEIDSSDSIYYLNLFKYFEEYKTNPENVNKSYISKKVILNNILEKLIEDGEI